MQLQYNMHGKRCQVGPRFFRIKMAPTFELNKKEPYIVRCI